MIDPLFPLSVLPVHACVTRRTQAEKYRRRIAYIMVSMGRMEVNGIAFSCAFGFPFFPLRDPAKLTPFSCPFLTSSG
jgi:hypothetical protein